MLQQLKVLIEARKWKSFLQGDQYAKMLVANGLENSFYPELNDCDASVTGCEYLIARTGSIVLSSGLQSGRTASVYAPVHICIAYTDQLVYDIKDAINALKENYKDHLPSLITLATGQAERPILRKPWLLVYMARKRYFVS